MRGAVGVDRQSKCGLFVRLMLREVDGIVDRPAGEIGCGDEDAVVAVVENSDDRMALVVEVEVKAVFGDGGDIIGRNRIAGTRRWRFFTGVVLGSADERVGTVAVVETRDADVVFRVADVVGTVVVVEAFDAVTGLRGADLIRRTVDVVAGLGWLLGC